MAEPQEPASLDIAIKLKSYLYEFACTTFILNPSLLKLNVVSATLVLSYLLDLEAK